MIELAFDNTISVVLFSSHVSSKLWQPLVFEPLKTRLCTTRETVLLTIYYKTITIYQVIGLAKIAQEESLTTANVITRFQKQVFFC